MRLYEFDRAIQEGDEVTYRFTSDAASTLRQSRVVGSWFEYWIMANGDWAFKTYTNKL